MYVVNIAKKKQNKVKLGERLVGMYQLDFNTDLVRFFFQFLKSEMGAVMT